MTSAASSSGSSAQTPVLRRLTLDDAEEFAALSSVVERDHRTNLELSAAEYREFLPGAEATLDGAFVDGELVGWTGYMLPRVGAGAFRADLMGEVHPAHTGRGLGTLLAAHGLELARERHRSDAPDLPAGYVCRIGAGRADAAAVVRGLGFEPERYRFNMTADLADLGPTAPLPPEVLEDYEVVPFEAADSELLRAAHNDAFLDYPNYTPMAEHTWHVFMVEAAHTRHHLSRWLRSRVDGSVAAYVFTHEYSSPMSEVPGAKETYLPFIGTAPAHRGRGLASRLIGHCLHLHRDAGYTHCSLEVDAENPTGALGIYERAGFVVGARFDEYYLREGGA